MTTLLSADHIRRAPKVLLHDHLDGGVRPLTVIELAAETGYDKLPSTDLTELTKWFVQDDGATDLVRYISVFEHTIGVMQTPAALHRVAAECALDLARDGVVYAEVRFAPELHIEKGLSLDEIVEAVMDGFAAGVREAAAEGHIIVVRALLCAMRQAAHSLQIAELAVRHRDNGVVGFDVAGPEKGFPPTLHLDAFEFVRQENFHITIHAGEAFGLPSIWEALQHCGAERLGHGVRIVDDIQLVDGEWQLGRLASFVRDRRVPLELCPTSNVHTGAVASFKEHPIELLRQLGFRVTLNTDNRLMSGVTLSDEFASCQAAFGWGVDEMQWVTINSMKSAFFPFDQRLELINKVIKPGYQALRAELTA